MAGGRAAPDVLWTALSCCDPFFTPWSPAAIELNRSGPTRVDALHPQTLLAYGMNGRDLSVPHGAPVRLRVERQLGYKSMKFLHRIVVTDELDDGGDKGNPKNGWAWYAGI